MTPRHPVSSKTAYTLLELSLVLAVLSLLIAGVISAATQNTRRANMVEVKSKMDVIEAALLNFRQTSNRLPCPGDSTQPISGATAALQNFGIEAGYPTHIGTCTGNASPIPNATFYDSADTFTVGGDLPVKTLGLSDDYMFDPWGGRFFYAVDNRMTTANAPFTTYTVTSTTIGSISIKDGSGVNYKAQATSNAGGAIAVLMSYGPDGHGAYQLSGARKSTGNTNPNTAINCNCNGASPPTATAWTNPPVFIQAPANSTSPNDPANFDDIVRYYTRLSFLNGTDVTVTTR